MKSNKALANLSLDVRCYNEIQCKYQSVFIQKMINLYLNEVNAEDLNYKQFEDKLVKFVFKVIKSKGKCKIKELRTMRFTGLMKKFSMKNKLMSLMLFGDYIGSNTLLEYHFISFRKGVIINILSIYELCLFIMYFNLLKSKFFFLLYIILRTQLRSKKAEIFTKLLSVWKKGLCLSTCIYSTRSKSFGGLGVMMRTKKSYILDIFNSPKKNNIFYLPSKEHSFSMQRSPHVHKTSAEQWKLETYTNKINLSDFKSKVRMSFFDTLGVYIPYITCLTLVSNNLEIAKRDLVSCTEVNYGMDFSQDDDERIDAVSWTNYDIKAMYVGSLHTLILRVMSLINLKSSWVNDNIMSLCYCGLMSTLNIDKSVFSSADVLSGFKESYGLRSSICSSHLKKRVGPLLKRLYSMQFKQILLGLEGYHVKVSKLEACYDHSYLNELFTLLVLKSTFSRSIDDVLYLTIKRNYFRKSFLVGINNSNPIYKKKKMNKFLLRTLNKIKGFNTQRCHNQSISSIGSLVYKHEWDKNLIRKRHYRGLTIGLKEKLIRSGKNATMRRMESKFYNWSQLNLFGSTKTLDVAHINRIVESSISDVATTGSLYNLFTVIDLETYKNFY